MKGGFADQATAMSFRDILRGMVRSEVGRIRPSARYATVVSVDRPALKCTVNYTGETSPTVVNMGSVQPVYAGQQVRIEGGLNDRYIGDVTGGAVHEDCWDTAAWKWSTSTAATDPGAGFLKINNASLGSATALYVNHTDALACDATNVVHVCYGAGNAGAAVLTKANNPHAAILGLKITGRTHNAAWDSMTCTVFFAVGAFASGDIIMARMVP